MVLDFWPSDVFCNSRSFDPRFLARIGFRMGKTNAKKPLKTKHAVNERRRQGVEGTDRRVFHHQDAIAPAGFGPDRPAARGIQDDGDCVGRLEGRAWGSAVS